MPFEAKAYNVPKQSLEPFEQRQIEGTGPILYYYSPTQKENILEYFEVNFRGEANKATTGKAIATGFTNDGKELLWLMSTS